MFCNTASFYGKEKLALFLTLRWEDNPLSSATSYSIYLRVPPISGGLLHEVKRNETKWS